MWKKAVFLIFVFVLINIDPGWAVPLKVIVKNSTTGKNLSDYPITIEIRDKKGTSLLKSVQLKTDKSGAYEGDIEIEDASKVFVSVSYRGVTYRALPEKRDGDGLSFSISVYEITDRADSISIPYRTMVITPHNDNTLQIFEVLIVKNTGNKTFVGSFNDELDTDQVLFIPLPLGYRLNQVMGINTSKILTYNGGIVTQDVIPPGEREIVLGYFLRSDTGYFDLTLHPESRGPHPQRFNLLLSKDSNWRLKVSGLDASGVTNFYGKEFRVWTGFPGASLKASLYSPGYRSVYGGWIKVLLAALVVSSVVLLAGRSKIRARYQQQEVVQLNELLSYLDTNPEGNKGVYTPFVKVIKERIGFLTKKEQP